MFLLLIIEQVLERRALVNELGTICFVFAIIVVIRDDTRSITYTIEAALSDLQTTAFENGDGIRHCSIMRIEHKIVIMQR